jgi:hypothetical protein
MGQENSEFQLGTILSLMSHSLTLLTLYYSILRISIWFHVTICNNAWKFIMVTAHQKLQNRLCNRNTYNNFKIFSNPPIKKLSSDVAWSVYIIFKSPLLLLILKYRAIILPNNYQLRFPLSSFIVTDHSDDHPHAWWSRGRRW